MRRGLHTQTPGREGALCAAVQLPGLGRGTSEGPCRALRGRECRLPGVQEGEVTRGA